MNRFITVAARTFVLALLCSIFALVAYAQSTVDGAIGGTIYDARGAVVSNARITIVNNGTAQSKTVTADSSGFYRVPQLQPGDYTVTVEAAGFSSFKSEHVIVEVGRLTSIEPHLAVGGSTETVSVSAEAPQINTESPDFAQTVDQKQINDLPINGRRWSNFALLQPGVVADSNGFGLLSFRGISVLLNNNTVDGADNNQAYFSEERGRTRASYSTSQFSVREFTVNTSNYSAEYGRAAGGVVNTVTKSGTNQLHGIAAFYDRDNEWGAKNPYVTLTNPNTFVTSPYKPTDTRKQYGFGVGGPIIKDKLFWFYTFDQQRRNFPGTARVGTPGVFFDQPLAASTCKAPTGGSLNTGTSGACALSSNLAIPYAQAAGLYTQGQSAIAAGELGSVPRKGDQTINFPKLDWVINSANRASVSYNRLRWDSPAGIQTQASNTFGNSSFGNDFVKEDWGIARLNTVFGSNISNEVRYQYGRDFEYENSQKPNAFEQPLANNQFGRPPQFSVFSTTGIQLGKPNFLERGALPDERRNQIADTITWVRGNHVFKFGEDFNRVGDYISNLFQENGQYTYPTLGAFLSDYYHATQGLGPANYKGQYSGSFTQQFGPRAFSFNTKDYAFFVADDWKVSPRLTITLGARYEYEQLPSPILANAAIPQTAKFPGDKNNIGPRVGFAYDLLGTGKTVVRGGYGIYYGRIINSTIFNALTGTGNPAGQVAYNLTANPSSSQTVPGPIFPFIFASAPATSAKPSANFFDHNFQNPQIHETDLVVEQELGWNTVVSVSYLGSYGRQLPNFVDANFNRGAVSSISYNIVGGGPITSIAPNGVYTTKLFLNDPTTKGRLNPNFNAITDIVSNVNSSYNALSFQLNHRFQKGLQFNANYTWSHALDTNQNQQTGTATNNQTDPTNLRSDYGNSNYDVPLRLVINAVYQPQYHVNGWVGQIVNNFSFAPIYQWQNGLPYTLSVSGTPSGVNAALSGINGSGGPSRIIELGRNSFRQPNTSDLDLRISKRIAITERYRLELLGETFNLMNHQNITNVNNTGYLICSNNTAAGCVGTGASSLAPALVYQSSFGSFTNANSNTVYRERQIQVAVRFEF